MASTLLLRNQRAQSQMTTITPTATMYSE